MKPCFFLLVLAGLSLPAAAQGPEPVASLAGVVISTDELAAVAGASSRAGGLLALMWPRIAAHYTARHGLAATAAEVDEVLAYQREFRRKDRAQRARKLDQLGYRLAAEDLDPQERARLREFQAVLLRLALRDVERDKAPDQDRGRLQAFYAPLVEMWKINEAIYRQYGGVVALTEFGPSAHGARAALIADYEREGVLRYDEAGLRERVHALLDRPPSMVVPPDSVDFTPYWKLPIPPSYFPD